MNRDALGSSLRASRKLAIVTGAGDGLGRALCRRFVEYKIPVVGVSRNMDSLLETKKLCSDASLFYPFASDVSDLNGASDVFKKIDEFDYDDLILINNAAIYERHDFVTDSILVFEKSIQTNLMGTAYYTKLALSRMIEKRKGHIVNVGSFADLAPLAGSSGYSVSKGSLRLFSRAILADIGRRFPKVLINDWIPGALNTKMGLRDGLEPMDAALWGAKLALMDRPDINGRVFDMDKEIIPHRSLKKRVAELLFLRRPRRVIRIE